MPAATVASPRNIGRRAAAFLALCPLLLAAQPTAASRVTSDRASTFLRLDPASDTVRPVIRLEWSTEPVAVPKISVSTPRVPGTWLRVWPGTEDAPPWWFVSIGTGTSPDLRSGAWTVRGSVHVQVDWSGAAATRRDLPVIFTFTEG